MPIDIVIFHELNQIKSIQMEGTESNHFGHFFLKIPIVNSRPFS